MKRRALASGVASVAGFGMFGVARASVRDPDLENAPQAKLDAIGEARPVDADEITTTSLRQLDPRADSGPAGRVLEIRAVLPTLLKRDVARGQLPDLPVSERVAWARSAVDVPLLVTALRDVWAPGAVEERAREWANAIRLVAKDPSYPGYDRNSLTVVRWQGVSVDGDRATAVFVGHPSFHLPTGWVDDEDDQYQVVLEHSDGVGGLIAGWRLVSVDRIDHSDLGGAE